jgi:hypothetical protein
LLALAGALPALQQPSHVSVLLWPAAIGLALAATALALRLPRLLIWVAILLCGAEAAALEIGHHAANGLALAFAMLLFAGMESAYLASGAGDSFRSLAAHARSLPPVFLAAAAAAGLIALLPRVSAAHGSGLALTGLTGAAALVAVLALLAWHSRD